MSSDNFKCQEDFFCLRYWYTACHGQNLWHQVNACVGSNWSDSVLFIFVALTNLASDTGPAFAFGMTFFSHVVSLSIRPQIWTIWPVLNGVEFYESAFFLMIPDFFSFSICLVRLHPTLCHFRFFHYICHDGFVKKNTSFDEAFALHHASLRIVQTSFCLLFRLPDNQCTLWLSCTVCLFFLSIE